MKTLFVLSQLLFLVATGSLIWLVVRAFRRHIGWGLAVLFLSPFSAIFFAIRHWEDAKKPFLAYIGSLVSGFAILIFVFISWGGLEVLLAAKQMSQGIQDQTLTDKDARRFMEANINFVEKTADSEQDKAVVAVMRKFMRLSDSGLTEDEQRELSNDIFNLLERSDLSDEDRAKLQDMRRQMQSAETAPAASKGSLMENIKGMIPAEPSDPAQPENADGNLKPGGESSRFVSVPVNRAREHVGASVIITNRDGRSQQCALVKVSGSTLYFEKYISGGSIAFEYPSSEIQSLKVLVDY
jgi:hypothetical protein